MPLRAYILFSLVFLFFGIKTETYAQTPITYVNTLIGTEPATAGSAQRHSTSGGELKGQTMPAVGTPYAMTQWTPQTQATETKCVAPFYYKDPKIQGFRATHWLNGSCVQDYGTATFMAVSGKLKTRPAARASLYNKEKAIATPAFYSVRLEDHNVQVSMTATPRCGILQFDFEQGDQEHFVLFEPNSDEGEGYVEILAEKGEIVGYNPVHRIYQGSGQSAGFSGYFVIQFDAPWAGYGTWRDDDTYPEGKLLKGEKRGESLGAYASFGTKKQRVSARVGTSFTSLEAARKNLAAEIPDFDFAKIRKQNEANWNTALGKMTVQGSDEDKTLFYSALYRSKLSPRLFSDVSGSYPSFAGGSPTRQTDGSDYYCDFSLWDTFRSAMPLHILLEPEKAGNMMQSLTLKAEQGGWMPIFPCWNSYTAAMVGDHVLSTMADAYAKGVRGFDVAKAYKYLRKNAFESNTDPESYAAGQGRRALDSYLKYGYVPLEDSVWQAFHKREQTSRTLEYAYDDYCLSTLAQSLGHAEDATLLRKRALNYKNVIDPGTGYARGRHADGRWSADFDPFVNRASFITEGSPAQYTFFVPQDVAGLMQHVGGREVFVNKLDTLFRQNYYWHGNEPNHQIAYLYAYAGEPWKSQQQVRKIISEEYGTEPNGLSGNEDGGQMSAWLVFSMAGLYPVCPGTPYYVLGSPVFGEMALKLDNGKTFKIITSRNGSDAPYIQSAKLNGKAFTKTYLTHEQLTAGGKLELVMGKNPNKKWGVGKGDVPPGI